MTSAFTPEGDDPRPESPAGSGTRPTLRFLTCGSVDDGKSTLIGRLLYEKNLIHEDQLAALERDSRKHGTVGDEIDFALLVDGLEAERDQGITIDVAYRYFATERRAFIVADTPGHEQYTRNMATGASNADLAVILVDARKGLLTQTFRHAVIASMLGVRHVVLAVNKLDLVSFSEAAFTEIVHGFEAFAASLAFTTVAAIPLSARDGDNISTHSPRTPWYRGPHLVDYLEQIDVSRERFTLPFRMAVQWVNRPHLDFRGFAGTVASGTVRVGDSIVIAVSGRSTTVKQIIAPQGDVRFAQAGDAVTLTLADEVDVTRGDLIVDATNRPQVADQFAAHLIWMIDEPLLPGRSYLMKMNERTVPVTVTNLKHRVDVNTLAKLAAKTLAFNEIGYCNISSVAPVAFDPYVENRETGAFILIDRMTNATAAAGMVSFGLNRAANVHWQALAVTREARARIKYQRPVIVWFTGLSASGKSTIANLVESRLHARGAHTTMLDGDNIRHGINKDLGFTEVDRVENIRRIGEIAKLMTEAGLVVLCSFISPYHKERQMVRELVAAGEFFEVFVDTPIDECIRRDPKGLYKRALAGQIKNFTGIDQAYEAPETPELHLRTGEAAAEELADRVVAMLMARGIISA